MTIQKNNPELHIDLIEPGIYLKAADLRDKLVTLTVKSVGVEEMENSEGETETKLVLGFSETDRLFLMNKTNRIAFAIICGDKKAAHWVGKKITIGPHLCKSFGDPNTESIRVIDSEGKVFYKARKTKAWVNRRWYKQEEEK